MSISFLLLFGTVAISFNFLAIPFLSSCDRYLSPEGSDTTDCESQPCRTLKHVFSVLKQGEPEIIHVEKGSFIINESLSLGSGYGAVSIAGVSGVKFELDGASLCINTGKDSILTDVDFSIKGSALEIVGGIIRSDIQVHSTSSKLSSFVKASYLDACSLCGDISSADYLCDVPVISRSSFSSVSSSSRSVMFKGPRLRISDCTFHFNEVMISSGATEVFMNNSIVMGQSAIAFESMEGKFNSSNNTYIRNENVIFHISSSVLKEGAVSIDCVHDRFLSNSHFCVLGDAVAGTFSFHQSIVKDHHSKGIMSLKGFRNVSVAHSSFSNCSCHPFFDFANVTAIDFLQVDIFRNFINETSEEDASIFSVIGSCDLKLDSCSLTTTISTSLALFHVVSPSVLHIQNSTITNNSISNGLVCGLKCEKSATVFIDDESKFMFNYINDTEGSRICVFDKLPWTMYLCSLKYHGNVCPIPCPPLPKPPKYIYRYIVFGALSLLAFAVICGICIVYAIVSVRVFCFFQERQNDTTYEQDCRKPLVINE